MKKELSDFEKAFSAAHDRGDDTFMWNGELKTTKRADGSMSKKRQQVMASRNAPKQDAPKTAEPAKTAAPAKAEEPFDNEAHKRLLKSDFASGRAEPSGIMEDAAMLGAGGAAIRLAKGIGAAVKKGVSKVLDDAPKPWSGVSRPVEPKIGKPLDQQRREAQASGESPAVFREGGKRPTDNPKVMRENPERVKAREAKRREDRDESRYADEGNPNYANGGMMGKASPSMPAQSRANPTLPSNVPSWAAPIANSFFKDGGMVSNCSPRDFGKKK